MKDIHEGGCNCGAVRYRTEGRLGDVLNCHCGQCRRTHGHIAAYTTAAKSDFSLLEERGLKWYASSDLARRGFCGECGSSLFWDSLAGEGIGIAAGTLDGPTGLKTVVEIFVADQSDYYQLNPALPHYQGGDID
jgi:hypothetical protein